MAAVETWILSSVCLLALGGVAIMSRKNIEDAKQVLQGSVDNVKENFEKLEEHVEAGLDRFEEEKDSFVTRELHELACRNQSLEVNKHLTAEIGELKDQTFEYLRNLETKIDRALGTRRGEDKG